MIVDVAKPGDMRIEEKEQEITKYKDVQIEIEHLWERKAKIGPFVGALGTIPKDLEKRLNILGVNEITTHQLQKAVVLGTAYIFSEIPVNIQSPWGGPDI